MDRMKKKLVLPIRTKIKKVTAKLRKLKGLASKASGAYLPRRRESRIGIVYFFYSRSYF